MKHLLHILILSLVALSAKAGVYTVDNLPNAQVVDHTKHLTNPDAIISPAANAQIDSLLADIRSTSTCEVAVVVVDDIDSDDPSTFATELFEKWGVGKDDRDNGLLWLVIKDKKYAVARTGYGVEGVLPDGKIGTIMRRQVYPLFKQGNYEQGVIEGVKAFHQVLTDPDNIEELRSAHRDKRQDDGDILFMVWIGLSIFMAVGGLIWYMYTIVASRHYSDFDRYNRLEKLKAPLLFCSFLGLGLPLIAYLPLWLTMRRLRNKPHLCANCGTAMKRLDEQTDNLYLTPAQDTEERINSVDYDVWLCPNCNATEVLPYINKSKSYTECERCGARACTLESDRVLVNPTHNSEGKGVRTYCCLNCHNRTQKYYD
ncbi:MAG: TPM domain-containing protein, partial [Muribaculaceae bacterium]|nr:TPM domain-containing protein [Muribaculaceae bacterium]